MGEFEGKKLLQKYRVAIGLVAGVVFLIFSRPTLISMALGGLVALSGLAIRAWASGHIRKNRELAVSGPYAYTRNPLYLGSLVLAIGFSIATGIWWVAVLVTILFIGIYFPVMSVEAQELTDIFGEDYQKYAGQVSLFFPWFSDCERGENKFELALYLRYREYRAFLGALFAWIVLALKVYFVK